MIPTLDTRYKKLINHLPLMPIADDEHYALAIEALTEILKSTPEPTGTTLAYFQVLSDLVGKYEKVKFANTFKSVPGNHILQYLMTEHSLTQTELARIAGVVKQNINGFLNGLRGLPKEARQKLGKHFNVDPAIFE